VAATTLRGNPPGHVINGFQGKLKLETIDLKPKIRIFTGFL
jgi:hypothetical protein